MSMLDVGDFKKKFREFMKTLKYLTDNWEQIEKDGKAEKYKHNFYKKKAEPMDEAWNNLTEDEKNRFLAVYQQGKNTKTPF